MPPVLPSSPLLLPAEDRVRSPYTGWTRDHWTTLADRMLAAVAPHRSPGGALIALPGPASSSGERSDALEGFARTFLLAGFRVAGEQGADPTGLLEQYARGLAAGTDPHSPEAWPRPDRLGQAKVEAASVALVLQLTRPWLWDRLDDGVRERVVDWLGTVVGQEYPPINWVWFRIVVESFLREVGGPHSVADIEADLAVHASLRRPGGWLSDGQERAYDHYTGWALHLYPLLWTRLFDVTGTLCSPALRATWEQDLARYLADAVHLVGADGSPLLQGRSLSYRFAAAAPLWLDAVAGVDSLSPGLVRRATSGMLRHFAEHGSPDADGLLTLGWHAAWPRIRQSYSGPGSPYWASKGMLGLLLPADHPVWTAPEEPLPTERGDSARVLTAPGWIVSSRRADGIAVVLNHGTDHARAGEALADSPLYARLGYSTATLPPLTGATVADPVDNAVVVLDAAGRATHRTGFETLLVRQLPDGAAAAASRGPVHWVDSAADTSPDHGSGRRGPATPGPVVTVASVLRQGVEVRLARLDPREGGAAAHAVRLGGWPVSGVIPPETRAGSGVAAGAAATTGQLHSSVHNLTGFEEAGVHTEEDTGPLGRWTAVPWLATATPAPVGRLLAAAVVLTRPAGAPAPSLPVLTVGARSADGVAITVTWPDGVTTDVTLPL